MIDKINLKYVDYYYNLNGYIKEFMIPIQKMIPNYGLVDSELCAKEWVFNELMKIPDTSKTLLTINFCELSNFLNEFGEINDENSLKEQVNAFVTNKTIKYELNCENNLLVIKNSDSLKKITKSTKISSYEVMTPTGWVDVEALHETIPYQVYELKLDNGYELKCADNHIIINEINEEVFVKDLKNGDVIKTDNGTSKVVSVTGLGYEEVMYDLELSEDSDRVYYTNGILSHNTYLSKLLAEHMFGDIDSLIRMDMSEYMEKHSVSRLIGPPPGYVGYGEGGQLTEKVRRKPYSVILFDEIEKAHNDVFNILLQVLDEGQLTDGSGRKINFKNTLIILTSNVGIKQVNEFGNNLGFKTSATIVNEQEKSRSIIEKALKKKFNPEFLNRIDDTIIFNSLNQNDINLIIKHELGKLKARLLEVNYKIKVNKSAIDYVAKEGYDEAYGARPLNRAIQRYIEDPIADAILNGKVNEGQLIKISYDKKIGEIIIS
jgi:hypothetical protein